jgi:hypothetical protein
MVLKSLKGSKHRQICAIFPVLVISGADLNEEQNQKLTNLGKTMLQKGMLEQDELFNTLEKALKRQNRNKQKGVPINRCAFFENSDPGE